MIVAREGIDGGEPAGADCDVPIIAGTAGDGRGAIEEGRPGRVTQLGVVRFQLGDGGRVIDTQSRERRQGVAVEVAEGDIPQRLVVGRIGLRAGRDGLVVIEVERGLEELAAQLVETIERLPQGHDESGERVDDQLIRIKI